MHAYLYNEAIFALELRPQTPLLIKAGSSGEEALDPTLPDMSFVRIQRPDKAEPEIYIPGSSLRGVVRNHAEKLLRSIKHELACDPTRTKEGGRLKMACFAGQSNTANIDGQQAYNDSCYACRLFGNTALAGRLRVGDMQVLAEPEPLLSRRYGVAIDRITGSVAQGPFEIETLTDARFTGQLTVRNFTLGQLGLLAAALLDMNDGLVPMGYGKSRGLGRVELRFNELTVRTLRDPQRAITGIGALARDAERTAYKLPNASAERFAVESSAQRQRGYFTLRTQAETAVTWLEGVANHWVKEVEGGDA